MNIRRMMQKISYLVLALVMSACTPSIVAKKKLSSIISSALTFWDGDYPMRYIPSDIVSSIIFSVHSKDFNNDGNLDLAYSSQFTGILVRLGNGDGTFGTATSYGYATSIQVVLSEDMDHDGFNDLIFVSESSGQIGIALNNGNGTFGAMVTTVNTGSTPYGLAVVDLNNDGWHDVMSADIGANTSTVALNTGTNGYTFNAPVTYATGAAPASVVAKDLNADGFADLITADAGAPSVSFRLNNGAGAFGVIQTLALAAAPSDVASEDVNGDTFNDIITYEDTNSLVKVYYNSGTGTFPTSNSYSVGTNQPRNIEVADMNGDGSVDIATANYVGKSFSVLLNDGDGTFGSAIDYANGTQPYCLFIGDLDNDGYPDLIGGGDYGSQLAGVFIRLNDGSGGFGNVGYADSIATGAMPSSVVAKDLNGDGYDDLFTADLVNQSVSVMLNNQDGTFAAAVQYPTYSATPYSAVADDMDNDGDLDIVVAENGTNAVSILSNNGDGTFGLPVAQSLAGDATFVSTGDFNEDGLMDIVAAEAGADTIDVLIQQSPGIYNLPSTFFAGGDPYILHVADVNDDDHLDVLTVNKIDSTLGVLLGDGNGSFAAVVPYALGQTGWGLDAGDLDGDGDLDVVVAGGAGNNKVETLFNNGDGTFGAAVGHDVGVFPIMVKLEDLDNDGNLDIITANYNLNNFSITFNSSGDGAFTDLPVYYQTMLSPADVFVSDLNHDGFKDIVTADQSSNQVSVFLWQEK